MYKRAISRETILRSLVGHSLLTLLLRKRGSRRGGPAAFLFLLLATTVPAVGQSVEKQTFSVPMRDGVKLGTDVFFPSTNSAFPVLLARTPYNKLISASAGEDGARHGYVTVIQDTRGRF